MMQPPESGRIGRAIRPPPPISAIVLLYAVVSALWILLSDRLVDWLFEDRVAILLAGMLKGVLFVAVTSLLLYGLLRRRDTTAASHVPLGRSMGAAVSLIGLAIAVLTSVAIVQSLIQHQDTETARLQAIADLKTRWIAEWLGERERDLRLIQASQALVGDYRRWREAGDPAALERLKRRLEDYRDQLGDVDVLLCDARGELLWDAGEAPGGALDEVLRAAVSRAAQQRAIGRLGPYRPVSGPVLVDFVLPVAPTGVDPAVVVFRNDPGRQLFPLLAAWPVASASGESVLFRRDGDEVLFLNPLRYRSDSAAKLRVLLTRKDMISVQVVRGDAPSGSVVTGLDYRMVPAIGVVRAIPGADWYLAVEMDQAEVYAHAASSVAWITFSGLLAGLVAASAAVMLRQRQRLAVAEQLAAAQAERLHALQLLDAVAESSTDAIFAKDTGGRYLLFNRAAARFTGQAREQVLGRDDAALFPPEQVEAIMARDRQVLRQQCALTFQEERDTPEGRVVFLTTKGPLRDAAGQVIGLFGMSRDITDWLESEKSARLWSQIFEHAELGLALGNAEHDTFVAVNSAFARQHGYNPEELVGQPLLTIYPPELHDDIRRRIQMLDKVGHGVFESLHVSKDGRRFPVLMDVTVIRSPNGRPVQCVGYALDISDRKHAEESVRRLNRALGARSECNQAVVRAADECELLQSICELLTNVGGYRMAWVGYAERDEAHRVRPLARAGACTDWLDGIDICWADHERGGGPTGVAIRERRVVVASELAGDARFAAWRERVAHCGFAGSIALPLMLDDADGLGALNLYSADADSFDEDEQRLLIALADDLAFGIRTLRERAERQRAEQELRGSERRFRQLFDLAPVPLVYADRDDQILAVNARFEQTFGYSRAEISTQGDWWLRAFPDPDGRQGVMAARQAARRQSTAQGSEIAAGEFRITCNDGKVRTVLISVAAIGDKLLTACVDMTERQRAEQERSAQLDELRRWYQVTLGRERRVLDLKREVNDLRAASGRPPRYASVAGSEPPDDST